MEISGKAQFPDEQGWTGDFVRQGDAFRDRVKADGSSAFACPWAHRTIIVRRLKKLENAIGMTKLFEMLDELEKRLQRSRYLFGSQPVETDWRLFVTQVRFDPVYHGHFKCNLRRIVDYPNLSGYLRDLFQLDGISETVNFDQIKRHYYYTHDDINPTRIAHQDLWLAHGRESLA